jgi:lysozyme family protein
MDRIEKIILAMINRWEGTKYENNPHDRGGPTKYGVTQKTLGDYLGKPATPDMVRVMPIGTAISIYRSMYWRAINLDRLPEELQPVIFDMAVNLGPGTAVRLLQHALGDLGRPVIGDGRLGPITTGVAAGLIKDRGAKRVIDAICDQRRAYYEHIIAEDPSQSVFRTGWLDRCESYRLPAGS